MKTRKMISVLLICAILIAGCASPITPQAQPATETGSPDVQFMETPGAEFGSESETVNAVLELTEEQNGERAAVIVNDTIRILLIGNPTTGYTWETDSLDTALLEQQGQPEYTANSNLKGAGGNFVFSFKAIKVGMTKLQLVYHRPFEKEKPPERVYEVIVEIQE